MTGLAFLGYWCVGLTLVCMALILWVANLSVRLKDLEHTWDQPHPGSTLVNDIVEQARQKQRRTMHDPPMSGP